MATDTTLKIGILVPIMKHICGITPEYQGKTERDVEEYIISKFNKYGEMVYPGIVRDIKEAKRAEQEFLNKGIDIIIVVGLGYSTSDVTFTALRNIKKPIILLTTSTKETIPANYSLTEASVEQYVLSNVEISHVLKMAGKKHVYSVAGLIDDNNMLLKIAEYLKAARVIKKLQNSNIGFIGESTFPGMLDIILDDDAVKDRFGVNIIRFSNEEIIDTFKNITAGQIEEEKKQMLEKFKNISIDKNDESFNRSIQMGLCYKNLINKYYLVSVANYCYPVMRDPRVGVPACMGSVMCTTEGVPFSCEGDIGTAIALYVSKEILGASALVEFSLADYKKNAILMFHCGNGNLDFSRSPEDVEIKHQDSFKEETRTVDDSFDGIAFEFSSRDGKAMLLSISPNPDSGWQINICTGEIKYYDPVKLSIPQSWWQVRGSLEEFIEKWCASGPVHHMALGYGSHMGILAKFSSLLDLKSYTFE